MRKLVGLQAIIGYGAALGLLAGGVATARAASVVRAAGGGQQFRLSVPTRGVFCLSISLGKKAPRPRKTLFIAPHLRPPTATRQGRGLFEQKFGGVVLHQKGGYATLLGPGGKVVVPHIALAGVKNPRSHRNSMVLTIGSPAGKPLAAALQQRLYGSGSDQSQITLMPDTVHTGVGNGDAFIPYYWSTAGYGVFVVSSKNQQQPTRVFDPQRGIVQFRDLPGNSVDVYLIPAARQAEALRAYTRLTGRALVPPEWAFGYLQSRWGWKNAAFVRKTLLTFRAKKMPVDAFIFDFEWYTPTPDYQLPVNGLPTYHDFRFNKIMFPHPRQQEAFFKKHQLHWMGIRKPRLGSSAHLAMARKRGWLLAPGRDPVTSRDINFGLRAVRRWWFKNNEKFIRAGMAGWWNDEGEATYTLYYYWNQAEYDGLLRMGSKQRQFSINRAFCPGVARLGATVWTGDTGTVWPTLRQQPPHLLNYGLAGMPYGTCDIGGFNGNPTPRLMARFMEAGAFFPLMRCHSSLGNIAHFPWLFGPQAQRAMRKALDLRYRLVPMLYSLAHDNYRTGMPLMRPLALEFPHDKKVVNTSSEWMLGRGLLVAPMLSAAGGRSVYLPRGTWYVFGKSRTVVGPKRVQVKLTLSQVPLYVRQGTVLPLGPVVQSTQDLPGGPLTVEVYPGADGHFTLTEDDGVSYAYRKGMVRRTVFRWNNAQRRLSWKRSGPYKGKNVFRQLRVVVHFPQGKRVKNHALSAAGSVTFAAKHS